MKILITSATFIEIQTLVNTFKLINKRNLKINTYSYRSLEIDVLITGIGMVATAYWMGKILNKREYDLAFNIGIAGSFDENIQLGNVVNIERDRFSELGVEDEEKFIPLTDMKILEEDNFPFKKEGIVNTTFINSNILNNLPKVNGITVNTIHGNEDGIKRVKELYNPTTESMEGAAFLYACFVEKIPCAQIRSISNYVEPRNKNNWKVELAINNVNKKIIDILNEF